MVSVGKTPGRALANAAGKTGAPVPAKRATGRSRQPTLAQLRAFAAVADHLHFRDAATAIGMSQPALSSAVSALEEALGVQLLERTTRKVLLSPAGARLAVRAKTVLIELAALVEEADAARAPFTGTLRLGVIPTVAPYLLPAVLRLVHERYPDLDIQVHEEQTHSLLDGLHTGRLDLLLLAAPLGVSGVSELALFDEDFVLITPNGHELGGRDDLPREVLRDLDLLLLDEGHCLRDQALDVCREAGRADNPVATAATGLSTLVQLVAGGLGVTLLPHIAVAVETGRGERLRTARFAEPAPTRRIALAHRTGAARSADYAELAAELREAVRELPVRVVGE